MRLKGCQKQIVRMQSGDSRLFDEAFFVLRDDAAPPATGDMLAEANRILEQNMLPRPRRGGFSTLVGHTALFLGGAAAASLLWIFAILAVLLNRTSSIRHPSRKRVEHTSLATVNFRVFRRASP